MQISVYYLRIHIHRLKHIQEIIAELEWRAYNVAGVFWSNDFEADAKQIALLPWQERLWIENPPLEEADEIYEQIKERAFEFAEILIARAYAQ